MRGINVIIIIIIINDGTDDDDDTPSPTGNKVITFATLLTDAAFDTVELTPNIGV